MEELEGLLKENSDKRVKLIISDGVFSMDGNLAPLRQVKCCVELYKRSSALKWLIHTFLLTCIYLV